MTRRRRTIINDDGGEFGARTPVETRSREIVSKETQVKIPRAQAFWVALSLSVAVLVSAISPIMLGERIFYIATGTMALAAFLWSVQFEKDWMDRISLPFLVGLVAWCLWKFSDVAGWRVPEAWQPIPALLSLASLVFWWMFTGALWLTFVQRLGIPQLHQQQYIWRAVGNVLEWALKRDPPRPNSNRPLMNKSRRQAEPELPQREKTPVEELTELELFLMLVKELGGILTRDKLAGQSMANGRNLTKNAWGRCIEELAEMKYVENSGNGYEWLSGQDAQTALDAIVR